VVVSRDGRHIVTVTGTIEPEALGVTLTHEHVFIDGSVYFERLDAEDADEFAAAPVTLTNIERVRAASCSNRDNIVLRDAELAVEELAEYVALGGNALVDVTSSAEMGRDPLALRRIAERTGLAIVMGCGFYCEYAHPDPVARLDVEQLAELIVHDLLEGSDGVRAGIIGEIGVNGQEKGTWAYVGEMTPNEEKALRAACRASTATGAAVCVHQPNRASAVPEIMRVVAEERLDPGRVILGHMSSVPDFAMHLAALERGFWIAYDNFGMAGLTNAWLRQTSDDQRIEWALEVFRRGFGQRLLVSHDVWCKAQLLRFGGGGYGHVLRTIVPRLREGGLSDADVELLLVRNPAEVLAF
jgi:phosphotriesterase-related protein